jgi:hypothetical protein
MAQVGMNDMMMMKARINNSYNDEYNEGLIIASRFDMIYK